MHHLFKDYSGAIENTRRIADSIDMDLTFGNLLLPQYMIPKGSPTQDADDYLKYLSDSGTESLLGDISPDARKRLDHELAVIKNMGYAGLFFNYS